MNNIQLLYKYSSTTTFDKYKNKLPRTKNRYLGYLGVQDIIDIKT